MKNNVKIITFVFRTRPEAIRMAPVFKATMALDNHEVGVCITA